MPLDQMFAIFQKWDKISRKAASWAKISKNIANIWSKGISEVIHLKAMPKTVFIIPVSSKMT